MSYVTGTLSQDEEVKEIARLHWVNYIFPVISACIALLFLLVYLFTKELREGNGWWLVIVLIIWAAYNFLKLYTTEMVITNKRVICKTGIISIKTEELKKSKVESVEIKQSVWGRILRFATIYFSGTGTSKVIFKTVADPWAIKSRIDAVLDN